MTLYNIINHSGDHPEATFPFYAILINAVKYAKEGNCSSMHDFLTQWDGAEMMYNSMICYGNDELTFEESYRITSLVRKIYWKYKK